MATTILAAAAPDLAMLLGRRRDSGPHEIQLTVNHLTPAQLVVEAEILLDDGLRHLNAFRLISHGVRTNVAHYSHQINEYVLR